MKPHIITTEELHGAYRTVLASSNTNYGLKRLNGFLEIFSTGITATVFEVTLADDIKYFSSNVEKAIEFYNKL